MSKKSVIFLVVIIVFAFFAGRVAYADNGDLVSSTVKARVIKTEDKAKEDVNEQLVWVKILENKFRGSTVQFTHLLIEGSQYNIPLEKNMEVYVKIQYLEDSITGCSFAGLYRIKALKVLSFIFIIIVLLFGRLKGLRSIASLVVTGIFIYKLLIPWIIKGYDPIISTVGVSILIIVVSFIMIEGFTGKSFTAMFGTMCGTILAGVLSIYYGNVTHVVGLSDETVQVLMTHLPNNIDYRGLLFSGIIIGTLGAVMDVSMSITSVIYEIKRKRPGLGLFSLMKSGLKVGKDILATMINTLILAYASVSLPFFILNVLYDMPLLDTINSEYIVVEIIRALCGSIGMTATIPITSFVAAIKAR